MTDNTRGAWLIVASAAGFATLGILIKYAFAGGAGISTILAGRFLFAAVLLFLHLQVRRVPCAIPRRTLVQLLLMGAIGYGGMSLLYANSIHFLPASLTALLLYTYPALVTVLAVLVGDERFTVQKAISLAVCSAGLLLLLGASFGGVELEGVLSVLGASAIYSCYILIGNRILKNLDPLVTSLYVCASAGLAFLCYGLATGSLHLSSVTSAGWLAILGISIFPTLVGVLGFFAGLRLIGATSASIISMLEPLVTVLLCACLLGERVTPVQTLGGIILLTGAFNLQRGGSEKEAAVPEL